MTQLAPIPVPDLDSAPFWEACRNRQLKVQFCADCGTALYPPRPRCTACGSARLEWRAVSGQGRLYSWAVVHHSVHPLTGGQTPYVLLLVDLDEGVRMVSRLAGDGADAVVPGMRLEATFVEIAADVWLPHFRSAAVDRAPHDKTAG